MRILTVDGATHRIRITQMMQLVLSESEIKTVAFSIAKIICLLCAMFPCVAAAQDLQWIDVRELTIEGQGWTEDQLGQPFDRLPSEAQKTVRPPVWSLSQHSAGICARFVSDATAIHADWKLTSSRLAMPHMAATGVSGLDLYVRVTKEGGETSWKWLGSGQPRAQQNKARLTSGLSKESREYLLYLPLYNGVTEVRIGVDANSQLRPAPERPKGRQLPIVFYGTSITQGGCASRPGMVHTAILGRWFDRPVINLGFSGNGKMEPAVLHFMAQLDAAVFVIDCLPNMTPADVAKRTAPAVRLLREQHPNTPILLVEDRNYSDSFLVESKRKRNQQSQAELRKAFESLAAAKVDQLYYLQGNDLLGDDNEGTVDSSHPTDLGFWRQAVAFQKALAPILNP